MVASRDRRQGEGNHSRRCDIAHGSRFPTSCSSCSLCALCSSHVARPLARSVTFSPTTSWHDAGRNRRQQVSQSLTFPLQDKGMPPICGIPAKGWDHCRGPSNKGADWRRTQGVVSIHYHESTQTPATMSKECRQMVKRPVSSVDTSNYVFHKLVTVRSILTYSTKNRHSAKRLQVSSMKKPPQWAALSGHPDLPPGSPPSRRSPPEPCPL